MDVIHQLISQVAVACATLRIARRNKKPSREILRTVSREVLKNDMAVLRSLASARLLAVDLYQRLDLPAVNELRQEDDMEVYSAVYQDITHGRIFFLDAKSLASSDDAVFVAGVLKKLFNQIELMLTKKPEDLLMNSSDMLACFQSFGRIVDLKDSLFDVIKSHCLSLLSLCYQSCMLIEVRSKLTVVRCLRRLTNCQRLSRCLCDYIVDYLLTCEQCLPVELDESPFSLTSWCEAEGEAFFIDCLEALLFDQTVAGGGKWCADTDESLAKLMTRVNSCSAMKFMLMTPAWSIPSDS